MSSKSAFGGAWNCWSVITGLGVVLSSFDINPTEVFLIVTLDLPSRGWVPLANGLGVLCILAGLHHSQPEDASGLVSGWLCILVLLFYAWLGRWCINDLNWLGQYWLVLERYNVQRKSLCKQEVLVCLAKRYGIFAKARGYGRTLKDPGHDVEKTSGNWVTYLALFLNFKKKCWTRIHN